DRPCRSQRSRQVQVGGAPRPAGAAARRLLQGGRRPDPPEDHPRSQRRAGRLGPHRLLEPDGCPRCRGRAVLHGSHPGARLRHLHEQHDRRPDTRRGRPDGLRGGGDLRPGHRRRVPGAWPPRRCGVRHPASVGHLRASPAPGPEGEAQGAAGPPPPRLGPDAGTDAHRRGRASRRLSGVDGRPGPRRAERAQLV
ncbi:MAG: Putative ATP-binding protein, partial [uncultured Nocardioides sp.]